MKKYLFGLLAFAFAFAVSAQSTTPRFGTSARSDNTGRVLTWGYKTPTLAATDSITPGAYKTIVKPATLAGNKTIKVKTGSSSAADEMVIVFTSDNNSGGRTVTFSTGFVVSASTLVVDSVQKATISFIFDGTSWVETARAKQ